MEKPREHPELAEERVLALLSPGNVTRLDFYKKHVTSVFPRVQFIAPKNLEHLREAIRRSWNTHRIVMAIGGDGTLHQVLKHINLSEQVLAVLPSGTGNDLASHLGFPKTDKERVAHLASCTPQATDYGTIDDIRFHNSAGFGIDSATLKVRNTAKGLLHKSYNAAFLKVLSELKCPELKVELAEREHSGRFYWVLAMNSPVIGGGTRIAPEAEIDDGLLDFMLVHEVSKLKMLGIMPKAIKGHHIDLPYVDYQQVTEATARQEGGITYLAVDGELYFYGMPEVRWQIHPGGLQLLR